MYKDIELGLEGRLWDVVVVFGSLFILFWGVFVFACWVVCLFKTTTPLEIKENPRKVERRIL